MTDTQRVTDDDVRHVADQLKHDLDEARALAQSQAATIAELRAEVERMSVKTIETLESAASEVVRVNGLWDAAESALATATAKIEKLEAAAQHLWGLLDDIDTASDMCKADDVAYRKVVERLQRRRFEVGTTDGCTVTFAARQEDKPHG